MPHLNALPLYQPHPYLVPFRIIIAVPDLPLALPRSPTITPVRANGTLLLIEAGCVERELIVTLEDCRQCCLYDSLR